MVMKPFSYKSLVAAPSRGEEPRQSIHLPEQFPSTPFSHVHEQDKAAWFSLKKSPGTSDHPAHENSSKGNCEGEFYSFGSVQPSICMEFSS